MDKDVIRISDLLCCLPGVTVRSVDHVADKVNMILIIRSIESMAALNFCLAGANVASTQYSVAASKPVSGWKDPENLWFEINAPHSVKPKNSPPTDFQLLGAYLVRFLHDSSIISKDDANALLDEWNVIPIGTT